MNYDGAVALAILALMSVASAPLVWARAPRPGPHARQWAVPILVVALIALAAAGWFAWAAAPLEPAHGARAVAAILAATAAVLGGSPVAMATLQLADPGLPGSPPGPADPEVLHGGAWVGALERAAVVAALLAGSVEGIAFALAVKGLGRYPELRAPAAAKRFLIGTFASVLWACGCAGVGAALQG